MRPLAPAVAPAGLLVQATGLTVRARSMRALGRSYSRTLRTEDDGQVVIDTGLYPASTDSSVTGVTSVPC